MKGICEHNDGPPNPRLQRWTLRHCNPILGPIERCFRNRNSGDWEQTKRRLNAQFLGQQVEWTKILFLPADHARTGFEGCASLEWNDWKESIPGPQNQGREDANRQRRWSKSGGPGDSQPGNPEFEQSVTWIRSGDW